MLAQGAAWRVVATEKTRRSRVEHLYDRGVVGELAEAVEALSIAPCVEEVEAVLRLRDRLDAKISEALRGLDAEEGWCADGSLTLGCWVAFRGRRSRKEAHREAAVAKRLTQLPGTAEAWAEGTLSTSQVAVIVANVSAKHAPLFAEQESLLVPELAQLSVRDTAIAMRTWRLRAEALDDEAGPEERPSELCISETLDGRREVTGHFSAEDGAVIDEAIKAASPPPWDGTQSGDEAVLPCTAAERRAEGLVEICRQFLSHLSRPGTGGRNRPQLNLVVRLDDLLAGGPGHISDGTPVGSATVQRLSCDSVLHRVVFSGRSAVLDYGTSTRTIPPALWAALVARDGHCRHPGCDRPPSWCEGHHIVHFSQGGPTKLGNIVLGCARHHHAWHARGWKLHLHPDATLDLVSPSGVLVSSRPPPRC
jgi:hypothetical protein